MQAKTDKRDRAEIFRERLIRAMETAQLNRSALARATDVNRSTISQLLDAEACRMPNAHLTAECARALGVSSDWLLGLTDRPERPGDLIAASMQMTQAERSSSDEQLLDWHREASGYKIRHVPATLPDVLKTEAVVRWEYEAFLGKTPDQAFGAMQDKIDWLRTGSSDYEIAIPLHELEAFAAGAGYYQGLSRAARAEQLDHLISECDALFPSLRLYLFNARRQFSAPLTLFGPLVGVIYVGKFYLAFRESGRIKTLTEHFDWLVREAEVDARNAAKHIAELRQRLL